jgi:short-subunit dehydrogenase
MIARKSGHIVAISSVMGKIGTPLRSSYAASKHAIQGFFNCMRPEVHQYNIDVTLIKPGYIKTNVTVNALTPDGKKLNKMGDGQSGGMSPEDCAKRIISAIEAQKAEVQIAGIRESLAVWTYKQMPSLFNRIIKNAKVT